MKRRTSSHRRHNTPRELVVAVISDLHAYQGIEPDKAPSRLCVTETDPRKNPLCGLLTFVCLT
jgi:hypothetical protein